MKTKKNITTNMSKKGLGIQSKFENEYEYDYECEYGNNLPANRSSKVI